MHTEYRLAHLAAIGYTPTPAFWALPDHVPLPEAAAALRGSILRELRSADLGAERRVAFYAVGAAMCLLKDAHAPGWKQGYLDEMFVLDP